jgi:hypothetical protein
VVRVELCAPQASELTVYVHGCIGACCSIRSVRINSNTVCGSSDKICCVLACHGI